MAKAKDQSTAALQGDKEEALRVVRKWLANGKLTLDDETRHLLAILEA